MTQATVNNLGIEDLRKLIRETVHFPPTKWRSSWG